ncbi:PAS domain S-box protein [Ramlibacter sp. PS4R-6]|uniref:PAS domain S-box protein n=1 Tax=Ramlibacter sp. PS4R-6 TaxID=3133438 RepID=UPI00309A6C74
MSPAAAIATIPPGEWLAQMAQAIEEMLWVRDTRTGHIVYANPAFERFWGARAAADTLMAYVAPADRERLQRARESLLDTPYVEDYQVNLPASGILPARTARLRERAFRTRAATGEDWITYIARDVSWQFDTTAQLRAEMSRRADAERNLSDATQRLEALIATANDAVITIDEASNIVDWNASAERIFGWRRAEVLGRDLAHVIIPPAHRAQHMAGIQNYLQGGEGRIFNRRVETTALRRNGEEFDAELSVWPVRTDDGCTFSSFIRDISRRKGAERALAESEAKYRKVVENVNEGILVTAAGKILYANPKALALSGTDEATALTRPFIEYIHPDDRELVANNHIRRLRGENVESRYQFRVIHRSGEVRWLETSGVVIEWQNAPATLNFLSDVTERRLIEQEMQAALERERQLSELKSRFVAVASHEFRTPLAAILSSIELLDDYGARLPDGERKEVVGLVKAAVARMNKMIEQVLMTARMESGRFAFEPQPRSIPDLLVQVVAEMDQAHTQAARISVRCDGMDAPRLVDAKLLGHILVNLLGNALKYSPPDSAVTCSASAEGERLRFRVTDQGIGIPAADLPLLFESFHRGTNVGNIQGTGIGLHIVKQCVELHRGTIEVDSDVGRGATFHVDVHAPVAN